MNPLVYNRNKTTQYLRQSDLESLTAAELREILKDYRRIRRNLRWMRRQVRKAINSKIVQERLLKNKCEQCSGRGCLFCEVPVVKSEE